MDDIQRRPDLRWLFFSPSGRLGRGSFVKGWLFWVATSGVLITQLAGAEDNPVYAGLLSLAFIAFIPVSAISMFMLGFKRAHDMGTSGLVALLLLFPFVGFIYLAILVFAPSTAGKNGYGVQPDWPDQQQ